MFVTEIIPMTATAVSVPLLFYVFGILDAKQVFAGFVDENLIMFIGMFVIGRSILVSGLAEKLGKKILSKLHTEQGLLAAVMVTAMFLSMFLNNTGTVALMIPIICGICEASEISPSKFMMPLAFAASLGGMCTLIGTPPNLIVKSVMEETSGGYVGLFEFAKFGVPLCIFGLCYFLLISRKSKALNNGKEAVMPAKEDSEKFSLKNQIISGSVFVIVVALMLTEKQTGIPMCISSTVGALALVVAGVMSEKQAFDAIEMNTVFLMGGMFSVSKALAVTGAGELVAQKLAGAASKGGAVGFVMLLFLVSMLITQFMSNSAAAALFVPLSANIASLTGFDIKTILMVVALGSSCAFMTPIATPPNTMVMSYGGYEFRDYMKVGIPFSAICAVCVCVCLIVMKV